MVFVFIITVCLEIALLSSGLFRAGVEIGKGHKLISDNVIIDLLLTLILFGLTLGNFLYFVRYIAPQLK